MVAKASDFKRQKCKNSKLDGHIMISRKKSLKNCGRPNWMVPTSPSDSKQLANLQVLSGGF